MVEAAAAPALIASSSAAAFQPMRALVHQIAAEVFGGRSSSTTWPSTMTRARPTAWRYRDSATAVLALTWPVSISRSKCRVRVVMLTGLPVAGLTITRRTSSSGMPCRTINSTARRSCSAGA